MQKVTVLSRKQITKDTYIISTNKLFGFTPGQSVGVSLSHNMQPRLYSICSGVNDPYISILFKKVPEGVLTPRLSTLKINDTLLMSNPIGSFTHTNEPGFWIASGTGIAPFVSMITSGISNPVCLLQGAKTKEHVYFHDLFALHLGDKYHACLSQEVQTDHFSGRVSQWINTAKNLPLQLKYYLCGSPGMVVETRDLLIEKGVPFGQIVSEIYF